MATTKTAAAEPTQKDAQADQDRRAQEKAAKLAEDRKAITTDPKVDRNHPDNLVEVESMGVTRSVDGKKYGPFGKDAPKELRMVPKAIVETFGLKALVPADERIRAAEAEAQSKSGSKKAEA